MDGMNGNKIFKNYNDTNLIKNISKFIFVFFKIKLK